VYVAGAELLSLYRIITKNVTMIEKIDLLKLSGNQIGNESHIPYDDINTLAEKVNELTDAMNEVIKIHSQ